MADTGMPHSLPKGAHSWNHYKGPVHDQNYAQAIQDEELQALMRQVINSRKLEKDYKNIEDQIRCLKLRMYQQTQHEV